MFSNTPQNSRVISSEEDKMQPNHIESLVEISSSSSTLPAVSKAANTVELAEVERIVKKTLQQLQGTYNFEDVDTLAELMVPKVLFNMHGFERLEEEVASMKQSFDSYVHHSKVLNEDIAEIFLDLHNIYAKLERLDKKNTQLQRDNKFKKRVCEAKEFLKSNKHYITNDVGNAEASSFLPTLNKSSDAEDERNEESDAATNNANKLSERDVFLTNMIVAKKSNYSLKLNRNKNYYSEVQSLLNIEKSSKIEKQ